MEEEVILVQETFLETGKERLPRRSMRRRRVSTTASSCLRLSKPGAGPKEDWQSSRGSPCQR
eukprot:2298125-Amphidinium_carterae.1